MKTNWNVLFFIIAYLAMIGIRLPYVKQLKNRALVLEQSDVGGKFLLVLVSFSTFYLPLIYIFSSWMDWADYSMPAFAPFIGVVLFLIGIYVFWRGHLSLKDNFSPKMEIKEAQQLVTDGMYAYIRHPIYCAIWLLAIGQPLLIHNWIAGLSGVAAFSLFYFFRVRREEQMLLAHFGDAYATYMKETSGILPIKYIFRWLR